MGPASTDPDLLAGTPYRVIGRLGAGGMGELYEAEHAEIGRRVAVKLLHPHLRWQRDLVDRLRLEGRALGRLAHPNVVQAIDFGLTWDERPYLVMERLSGRTLADELAARGPLPPAEAVDLVIQALWGLAAVHAAGLVHRDIKPENVFVCDPVGGLGRVVKLIDLGVTKVVSAHTGGPSPLPVPTAEDVSMGTPLFFSPEQATGAPLDARSDVYAMGMVLYALVAGRGPFDHLTRLADVLAAHVGATPVPPSRHAPSPVPPALEAAISKALAKRPADRFPTAAAFAEELRRVGHALDAPAPAAAGPPLLLLFLSALGTTFVVSAAVTMLVLELLR
jgi:serine/threonine-protein kinase